MLALVLQHTQGNLSQAARILGINRSTLRAKLRAYGLAGDKPDTESEP